MLGRFRSGLRILIFHEIDKLDAFEIVIDTLARQKRLVNPSTAEALFRKQTIVSTSCLITFDDGFASQVAAARVLDRHGVKGIFFVCPGLIGQPRSSHHRIVEDKMETRPSYLMDWSDIRELLANGHVIGCHSMTHRRLSRADRSELPEEILKSGDLLAERLSTPVRWFAYPFGDIASIDADSLRLISTRYEFCCSGVGGANTSHTPRLAITRDALDLASPEKYQKFVIEGGLDIGFVLHRQRLNRLSC